MGLLDGKVAIVTGSGRGIGKAIAEKLASEGASVVVADIDEASAKETAEGLTSAGMDAIGVQVNVADRASVKAMVAAALDKWGRVDVLVNNAGVTRDSMLAKMTDEQWDLVMAVNLKGVFYCTQETIGHMVERAQEGAASNGKIVNISSTVGKSGNIGQTNYCASKAGVVGFTKALAKEYAKYAIQANAIQPGFIKTPMTDKIPEKVVQKFLAVIPLGRMGMPEDIANAVLFLASPLSDYMTGTVVEVTGGLNM
ncbi:MAG: 3-oxoacyl-[acyl-carrier-protein] reductase [Promethearchaeota archaeon]